MKKISETKNQDASQNAYLKFLHNLRCSTSTDGQSVKQKEWKVSIPGYD